MIESVAERRIRDIISKMPELYRKVLYWYYHTDSIEKTADKIELATFCVERILDDAYYTVENGLDFEIDETDFKNACQ